MKKYILTVVALLILFAGCTDPVNNITETIIDDRTSKVLGVTLLDTDENLINVSPVKGVRGSSIQFKARVEKTEGADTRGVTWSLSGSVSGASAINNAGILSIGAAEPLGTILIVTVTSVEEDDKITTQGVLCVDCSDCNGICTCPEPDLCDDCGDDPCTCPDPGLCVDCGNDPCTCPAPVITITTQPAASTNVIAGSVSGNLTVLANVTLGAALSYQWYSNTTASTVGGTPISGAVNFRYTIPTTLAVDTYYFFCEVRATGGAEPVRSTAAIVTVTLTPIPVIAITTQPVETTNVVAGNISGNLIVLANVTLGATLSYQWYSNTTASTVDGTSISGANNLFYAIPTTLTEGTYYYFCEVRATGGATSIRSEAAAVRVTLTPIPVISITTQPAANTTVTIGNVSGSLSVAASVTQGAVLSYQWFSNTTASNVGGTPINDETSASFAIPASLSQTAYYFCEVRATGGAASVRSNAATVTTTTTPVPVIAITTQPANINMTVGSNRTLTIAATASQGATLSYQWYSNTTASNAGGNPVGGATGSSYALPALALGAYYYFCEVSATGGAAPVRSNVAIVNVVESGSNILCPVCGEYPCVCPAPEPCPECGYYPCKCVPVIPGQPYTIFINAGFPSDGGTIIPSQTTAFAGETITLTAVPSSGYELTSLNVIGSTDLTIKSGTTRTFTMPASNVTVIPAWRIDPWGGNGGNILLYSNGVFHPNVEVHIPGYQFPAGTTDYVIYHYNSVTGELEREERPGLQASGADGTDMSPTGGTTTIRRDSLNIFAGPGFDVNLANVTGVSFYAKARPSQSAPTLYVEEFGLGRDRKNSNDGYRVQAMNTIITTEWQRFIVPVPTPRAIFIDELFFVWGARSGDLWIDHIELITNEIDYMEIIVPQPSEEINANPVATPIGTLTKGIKFEYTFVGIPEKGYLYEGFDFMPWFSETYSVAIGGSAVLQNDYIHPLPNSSGQNFTMTVSFRERSTMVTGTIGALKDWMFGDFENSYAEGGYWFWHAGWWGGFGWVRRPDGTGQNKFAMQCGINTPWQGMGRENQNWDFTPFNRISFWFANGEELHSLSTFRFGLETGSHSPAAPPGWHSCEAFGCTYRVYFAPDFSASAARLWERHEYNLNQFILDNGTTPITAAPGGVSAVTGWRLVCSNLRREGDWPNIAEITAMVPNP
ncbi:MAG: hypothetical protein FWD36_03865 [Treponema sp.]|nr:hypothetical protein [Treponema sp.]